MKKHNCQVCGNPVKPHDFATISTMGMVCGDCWAKGRCASPAAIHLDGAQKTACASEPELMALLLLRQGES